MTESESGYLLRVGEKGYVRCWYQGTSPWITGLSREGAYLFPTQRAANEASATIDYPRNVERVLIPATITIATGEPVVMNRQAS